MTTYMSLDEANREIEDLNARLTGATNASAAKGRLLSDVTEERDLLRELARGRGEMIEVLSAELGRARNLLRDAMKELLAIMRIANVPLPANIAADVKAAGLDV